MEQIKKEKFPVSREEKFPLKINERFDLWVSIVDDAEVSQEVKDGVKKGLEAFKDGGLKEWDTLNDACYFAAAAILGACNKEKENPESYALFENLRDDIWDFWNELKKD